MTGDVTPYTKLVTSEHQNSPKFMASLVCSVQPFADSVALLESIPGLYDLDVAVGVQLDAVGLWVGVSRDLPQALTGVYFGFDTAGIGFDQGVWQGPFDPTSGLVDLPDDIYRSLIRATIAANQWDGSIPQAYAVWDTLFSSTGTSILIQDNGDMSMLFCLTGPTPDAVTLGLVSLGELVLKPAGVAITAYYVPNNPFTPYFGFDVENASISGFDVGAWGAPI